MGSSITFGIDGGSISVDLPIRPEAAESVASRFRDLIKAAGRRPDSTSSGRLKVLSPPPARHASRGRASVMLALVAVLFFVAVAGVDDGRWAMTSASVLLVFAVAFAPILRLRMSRWVSGGCGLVAVGLAVDAGMTGEVLRMAGAAFAGVCAIAVARLGEPSAEDATG